MKEENSGLKVFLGSAVPVHPADVRLLPVFWQNQIIIIPIHVTVLNISIRSTTVWNQMLEMYSKWPNTAKMILNVLKCRGIKM